MSEEASYYRWVFPGKGACVSRGSPEEIKLAEKLLRGGTPRGLALFLKNIQSLYRRVQTTYSVEIYIL